MNQPQRKHAANRIESIVNKNLPHTEDVPNISQLHKEEVTKGTAKRISEKELSKIIKAGVKQIQDGSRYCNPNIEIVNLFEVNPKHKVAKKAAQKRNKAVEKRRTEAKAFILKQQDAIILGSSEEALAALKAAENYRA